MAKEDTQWKPGQSGNPAGRPPGVVSVVQKLKKKFRENPAIFDEYLERYLNNPANEKHIAEMLDGKPQQKTDLTSGGETIQPLLVEIIGKDNDTTEDENTD